MCMEKEGKRRGREGCNIEVNWDRKGSVKKTCMKKKGKKGEMKNNIILE